MQTLVQFAGLPAVQIFLGTLPLLGGVIWVSIQSNQRFATLERRIDRLEDRMDRIEAKLDRIIDKLGDLDKWVAVLEGGSLVR